MLPAILGLTALGILVSCTGVVALVFVLWPEPTVAEIIDFDTLDVPLPDVVAISEAEPTGAAQKRRRADPARFQGKGTAVGGEAAGADDLGDAAPRPDRFALRTRSVDAAPSGPVEAGLDRGGPGGALDLSIGTRSVARDANVTLDDPMAIRMMIGERMRAGIPELVNCYNRRLKQDPSLQGRWRLTFTVTPEGRATSAQAQALDSSDEELEACLVGHVERQWDFGRIAVSSPVVKTLTFKAM